MIQQRISIHAPRTGSDLEDTGGGTVKNIFQSTLPARGATRYDGAAESHITISIHAPRTGSDVPRRNIFRQETISIHAPRTGSDWTSFILSKMTAYFNPRSPHGERRAGQLAKNRIHIFQSTLPARGATRLRRRSLRPITFQSTLPARGATCFLSAGKY